MSETPAGEHSAENDAPGTRRASRPLTDDDWAQIDEAKRRHRATGCRVFDDQFAKCTCPIASAETAEGSSDE